MLIHPHRLDAPMAWLGLVLAAAATMAVVAAGQHRPTTTTDNRSTVIDLAHLDDLKTGGSDVYEVYYQPSGSEEVPRPNFQPIYSDVKFTPTYPEEEPADGHSVRRRSAEAVTMQSLIAKAEERRQRAGLRQQDSAVTPSIMPPPESTSAASSSAVTTSASVTTTSSGSTESRAAARSGKKLADNSDGDDYEDDSAESGHAANGDEMQESESQTVYRGQYPANRGGKPPMPEPKLKTGQAPPRPKRRPDPHQAATATNRRLDDRYYDPRAPPEDISSTQKVYPIPLEYINQIPGVQPPLPTGFESVAPSTHQQHEFSPSAQIEKLVNGIPTLVNDNSDAKQPQYIEYKQLKQLQEEKPTHLPPVIYREEFPPYPLIPYHDSRVTSPRSVSVSTPGASGQVIQPTAHSASSREDGARYSSLPASARQAQELPLYSVPATPSTPVLYYTPQQAQYGKVKQTGKPKYGYFPPENRVMPRVKHIEAECRDDFMKLRVAFNDSFAGLIYSAGYTHDNDCMYVNGTGSDIYEFYIQLNRCGTLGGSDHHKRDAVNKQPTKNFMWNTITIQYSPLIEEEWDEHFKVTCEYGYDFWKTVTFPFLEVETNTADPVVFTLTPPECFMEIRSGYGTTGPRITGPVHVGDPVTLLIYMRSQWDGFDIVVNDCVAHNGANKRIQLIDHQGCPVDDKLIAKFQGTWSQDDSMYQTVIYAHMKTFRFTGSPALYLECDIRMCHGSCPTQPCYWRDSPHHLRKRRSANSTEDGLAGDMEDEAGDEEKSLGVGTAEEASFSESVNLFQALQVLSSEEEEIAAKNTTVAESLTSSDMCVSTMVFTTVVGAISALLLISGLTISLLCFRVRRSDKGRNDDNKDMMNTLRSARSSRSEYVHSSQARIP